MKLKLCTTAISLFLCLVSSLAQAASCKEDVAQMKDQIIQYGSITTPGGNRFTKVYDVSESEPCTATAIYDYYDGCKIQWTMGNWGDTFHCAASLDDNDYLTH